MSNLPVYKILQHPVQKLYFKKNKTFFSKKLNKSYGKAKIKILFNSFVGDISSIHQ